MASGLPLSNSDAIDKSTATKFDLFAMNDNSAGSESHS